MNCPKCQSDSRVIRTGNISHQRVLRNRECAKGHRYQTIEVLVCIYKENRKRGKK